MAQANFIPQPTYEDYVLTDKQARQIAKQLLNIN
jgi:hypothetical protein